MEFQQLAFRGSTKYSKLLPQVVRFAFGWTIPRVERNLGYQGRVPRPILRLPDRTRKVLIAAISIFRREIVVKVRFLICLVVIGVSFSACGGGGSPSQSWSDGYSIGWGLRTEDASNCDGLFDSSASSSANRSEWIDGCVAGITTAR
jgi:hypothetical protein